MARTLTLLQAGARDVDYFRLYADIIDNPKFAAAPEDGGMSADTFRFWIWSLCIASGTPERDGRLPPITEIAFRCRMTVQQADAHLTTLQARKLVARDTKGNATVVGWSTFQPLVPKSTQRVRKHRATHKTDASSTAKIAQSLPRTDETFHETHETRFTPFHETHETRCETFLKRDETPLIDRETSSPSETSSLSLTSFDSKTPSPTSTTPQPPTGGLSSSLDGKPVGPVPEDVNAAVDLVRRELGEDAARSIEVLYEVVDRDVGGRWDCFAAAVGAARRTSRPIRDIRAYLVRMTKQFVHDGIPPEPVKLPARASPSAGGPPDGLTLSERKRRTREAMASWPEFQEGN